jgi:hypothetical protein
VDKEKLKYSAQIFSLLQRFIHGETPQKDLYEDLKKSLDFLQKLVSEEEIRLLSSWEQIVVLRLLHFLGYIKDTPKVAPFISFEDWSIDILSQSKINQGLLVGVINEAIEASHI